MPPVPMAKGSTRLAKPGLSSSYGGSGASEKDGMTHYIPLLFMSGKGTQWEPGNGFVRLVPLCDQGS